MTDTINQDEGASQNTDRELWREREGDYYADSIHVTAQRDIGISCGGTVYVKPVREWHRLAALSHPAPDVSGAEEVEAIRARHEARKREFGVTENMLYVGSPAIENDFATLLALLDAARAELAGVREAARPFLRPNIEPSVPDHADYGVYVMVGQIRRLAAALKDTQQ
jgi:hypothetical protein